MLSFEPTIPLTFPFPLGYRAVTPIRRECSRNSHQSVSPHVAQTTSPSFSRHWSNAALTPPNSPVSPSNAPISPRVSLTPLAQFQSSCRAASALHEFNGSSSADGNYFSCGPSPLYSPQLTQQPKTNILLQQLNSSSLFDQRSSVTQTDHSSLGGLQLPTMLNFVSQLSPSSRSDVLLPTSSSGVVSPMIRTTVSDYPLSNAEMKRRHLAVNRAAFNKHRLRVKKELAEIDDSDAPSIVSLNIEI